MSKETKSKIKISVNVNSLISEIKKVFKLILLDDHRRIIEKLEIEMTELREVLSLNK